MWWRKKKLQKVYLAYDKFTDIRKEFESESQNNDSICQWFGILNNGHKTEKVLIPKITMPENIQATVQLSSFHMLVMLYSKSFKVGFSSMWMENFQM